MPQLVQLQRDHESTGFVVIGNHVQSGDRKEILGVVRTMKVNFTITSQGSVDVANKASTIPRAYLFNSKGELVASGNPNEMKQTIKHLIQSEPHWLAAGKEYKKLGKLAAALKQVKTFRPIIKKLNKEKMKEGDAKEEAVYLLKRIRSHGKRTLKKAKTLESKDAYLALKVYKEVAVQWKGDKAGNKASERLKKLKKDKEFQTELKASTIAFHIRSELGKLIFVKGKVNLDHGRNKKIAGKVRQLNSVLTKKFAASKAAGSIESELKDHGF